MANYDVLAMISAADVLEEKAAGVPDLEVLEDCYGIAGQRTKTGLSGVLLGDRYNETLPEA